MRLTKARSKILDILKNAQHPLSASDFVDKVKVNKTTIYREFDFLIEKGLVEEVDFGDRKKRYELKGSSDHHHHLVCLDCKDVSNVTIEENFQIPKDFKVVKHSLEFFGLCANCQ